MEFKVFSPEEFDRIEDAWKKLQYGSEMTAFQLYDWYKNINALYFREKQKIFSANGYMFLLKKTANL